MELTPMIYTILLLTLTVDRAVALKDPVKYKKIVNAQRQRCYIGKRFIFPRIDWPHYQQTT